jgi:hypothetical protein
MSRKIFIFYIFASQLLFQLLWATSPIYTYDSLDGVLNHTFVSSVESAPAPNYNLISLHDHPLVFFDLNDSQLLLNEFQFFTASQGRDFLFWADEMIRRKWLESKEKAQALAELKKKHGEVVRGTLKPRLHQALRESGYADSEFILSQEGLTQLYRRHGVPTRVKVRHLLVGYEDAVRKKTHERTYGDADEISGGWDRLTARDARKYSDDGVDRAYWINNYGIEEDPRLGKYQFTREGLIYANGLDFDNYDYNSGDQYPFEFFDAYAHLAFSLTVGEVRRLEDSKERPGHPSGILIMKRLK